jgi:serine/threonine protein kinase
VEPFPNHVFLKMGSSSLWVAQDLNGEPKLDLLADPDHLFLHPQCEIIKDQRKIKVGRVPLEIGGKVKGIYLKRYNAFSWRYRLGSLFSPSGAYGSWVGAGILMRAGFHTGQPIAAVECRSWGMLTKSFYLSEEIPTGKTADAYWREELIPIRGAEGFRRRRNFLKGLARLFFYLHKGNIYHNDLKDANIVVSPDNEHREESFYLLDLEGIREYRRLNRRRQIKNLAQLNRTLGEFLCASEKLHFLKVYLGNAFSDRREKREWIRRILKRT